MRLFAGLELPSDYQNMLEKIKAAWEDRFTSRIAWTRPGNWHLTLKFLGEVNQEKLQRIREYIQDVKFERFQLQAGRAGFFGSRGQYRVAWIGLDSGADRAAELALKIDNELADMGFAKETRPFRGHLTVARIKKFNRHDPWSEFADYTQSIEWPEFRVSRVVLWQSILNASGPQYKLLTASAGSSPETGISR